MAQLPLPLPLPLGDEKDAYICWLKSEFAAANAIIDSLCLHVWYIGNLGDYDAVFSCINRRRQTWTATLYMQQHLTVAEVVNSLQDVAQKKLQASCPLSVSNVQNTSWHDRQTSFQEYGTKLPLCQRPKRGISDPYRKGPLESNPIENVVAVAKAPQESGDGKLPPPHSPINTSAGRSVYGVSSCDTRTIIEELEVTSDTTFADNAEPTKATEKASSSGCDDFDIDRLLKTEVAFATNGEDTRHAMIKSSMLFQCCELADGKMINDGESGELYENVFSDKEVDELVELISQLQAEGRRGSLGCMFSSSEKSANKPDTIQFGQNSNQGAQLNDHVSVPSFLQAMIKWLISCKILSAEKTPDSCVISIFNEGHYASPSTDQGGWERPVCFISLSGPSNMVFGHCIASDDQGKCEGPFEVTLPAGSVLLVDENFSGILQKAVPAAPTRRILLTLGKALSSQTRGLTYQITETKTRRESGVQPSWYSGALKQQMLGNGISMHQPCHLMPNYSDGATLQPIFPFPTSIHGNPYDRTLQQGWAGCPSQLQGNSSSGTGVFLPSIWPSGLLMSVTAGGLGFRRPGNSKRIEKHLKIKGSSDPAMVQKRDKIICPVVLDGAISTTIGTSPFSYSIDKSAPCQ